MAGSKLILGVKTDSGNQQSEAKSKNGKKEVGECGMF